MPVFRQVYKVETGWAKDRYQLQRRLVEQEDRASPVRQMVTLAAFLVVLYVGVALGIFEHNNPKCNQITALAHLWDALHFRKLEKFQ